MTTDDERRHVAAALRAYLAHPAPWHLGDAVGCALDEKGDYDKIARLADLIDPGDHIGDPDKMVDREALLTLAEEYKRKAEQAKRLHDDACRSKWPSSALVEARQFAYMMAFYNAHDSILEACGEAVA